MSRGTGASTVARDSLVVSIWTVVGRVSGLARAIAIAAVFGPTFLANIYQSTNLFPNLLFQLMAGPLIASVLVPPLVRQLDLSDRVGAARFANVSLGFITAGFGVLGLVAIALGPLLVRLLTLGVDDAEQGAAERTTWILLLLVLPQILVYGLIGVCIAVQQARGRFAIAAGGPVVENLGILITLLVVYSAFDTGRSLEATSNGLLLVLGAGTTASVVGHGLVQWFGARMAGFTLRPQIDRNDPEVRALAKLALASVGATGLESARFFSFIVVAGLIPGGVVAMQLGTAFSALPGAFGARPISQALLPRLARLRGTDDRQMFKEYRGAIGLTIWIALPAALGLVAISDPLADAVAFGEMATPRGVELVRVALLAWALSALSGSVFEIARQASYSARDGRGPLLAQLLRTFGVVPGILVAALVADGPEILLVLGLSVGLIDAAAAGLLDRRVRRGVHGSGELLRWVGRDLVLALAAAGFAWLVASGVQELGDGRAFAWGATLAGAVAGAVLYVGGQLRAGAPELKALGTIPGMRLPQRLRRS